jgi:hypothetical protein
VSGFLVGGNAARVRGPVSHAGHTFSLLVPFPPPPPTTLRSLVVNSSHLVDAMLTETEQGKALREMKQLDPGFDEFHFIQEMRDE